jgi:hypothetical protein
MKPKNDIQEELQKLGLKKLASFDKEPGFKVPDGYFESLANSISNNLPQVAIQRKTVSTSFFNLRMVTSIAASLLILVVFALSFLYLNKNKENGSLSQLPDYAYEDYFASLDEFSRMRANEYLLELDDIDSNDSFYNEEDEALLDYLLNEVNYQKFDPVFEIDLENN